MVTRVAEGMLRDVRDNIGHLTPATPSPARHRVPEGIDHTHGHGAEGTGHERGVVDGGLDRVPRILCGGDMLVAGSETGVTPEPGRVPCGVSVMVAAPAVDPPLTESVALPRGSTRVSSKESAVRVATDGLAMLALVVVTTIRGGPPMWDAADSAVDLDIGAPHFDVQGRVFRGFFTARIPTSWIQCRWGVSVVKANDFCIAVTAEDGSDVAVARSLIVRRGVVAISVTGFAYQDLTVSLIRTGKD